MRSELAQLRQQLAGRAGLAAADVGAPATTAQVAGRVVPMAAAAATAPTTTAQTEGRGGQASAGVASSSATPVAGQLGKTAAAGEDPANRAAPGAAAAQRAGNEDVDAHIDVGGRCLDAEAGEEV